MLPWTELLSLMSYFRTVLLGNVVEDEDEQEDTINTCDDEDLTALLLPHSSSHVDEEQNS